MRYFFAAATAVVLALGLAQAQVTTANFYGLVGDPTGARIPGATVTLTHEATGAVTTKTTDAEGEFVFDFLRVGRYKLEIRAPGFKLHTETGIELAAAQSVRRAFVLDLGAVTETVQVQGEAPLVNAVSAEQRESSTSFQVAQLPLPRRSYTNLLTIGTGVTVSNANSAPGHGNRDGGVRLNGLGRSGASFSVDGTDANANSEGRAGALFTNFNYIDIMSIEAVQQVQVVKGIIPAEYGQALAGNVNLITKSGANEFHGSLFENFQSDHLNARNQFLSNKAPLTLNQFGGSLGGPIRRERIFFFTTYEGYREASSPVVAGNVPTQKLRQEMVGAVPEYKRALDATPLPTEPHAPDADVGFYRAARSARAHDNHFVAKGDVRIGSRASLALTYTRGRPFRREPMIYITNDTEFHGWQERGTATFLTGGASWTSETRFGYNLQDLETFDAFLAQGVSEERLFGRRVPAISSSLGFDTPSAQIWSQYGPGWSMEQKYARHHGKHSLKFGGDFFHRTGGRVKVNNPIIGYVGKADLLANVPTTVNITFGPNFFNGNSYEFGFFAQDDWRVTPRLVVNWGARYDFYSKMVARPIHRGEEAAFYNLDGLRDNHFTFGPFRDPENPYQNDGWVNVGPRLSFSYNPDGRSRTVIRGGFGVLFSPHMQGVTKQAVGAKLIPFRVIFSKQEAARNGFRYPTYNDEARKIVEAEAQRSSKIKVFSVFDPHLQNPYSMNLYLGVQHEWTPSLMLETAFVGTRGVKFVMHRIFNEVDRTTGQRPNPNLNDGFYVDNTQNTVYASWQTSLRKRYSQNLTGGVHYTWGKALSTAGGDIGAYYQGDQGVRTQDFFNPKADRGPSSGDLTHYFAADFVYELPRLAGVGNPVTRHTLGGWQVSGLFTAMSGEPLIITQSSSLQASRPDYVGGRAVNSDYRKTLQYLNKDAFRRLAISPASGATVRPGNVGQGAVRGPGQWRLDFSLAKNFSMSERRQLQMRMDSFNFLNHTNYVGLVTNINSPTFGRLTSARGARVIQLNGRFSF